MDGGLDLPAPSALPPPGFGAPSAPGRPSADPAKRVLNDEKYQKTMDLLALLPDSAREWKMLFFEAREHSDTKADFRPLHKMTITEFADAGLKDEGALASYCEERFGPGRYLIEPVDEHNRRIDKAPHVIISTEGYMNDELDDDREYGRRGRGRRYTDDDLDDDDPRSQRANLGDLATTLARQQHATTQANNQQTQQLATAVILSQKEQQASQVQVELRREELAENRRREEREERRREDERAEQRRKEERDEQRRLEEREREREREERKEEREERRRQDERAEAQRREDRDKQDRAQREAIDASNKRMELVIAALPIIKEMFHRPEPRPVEDKLQPLLIAKLTEKKDVDPIMMMFVKDAFERRNTNNGSDSMQMVIQGIVAASKAQSDMQNEFSMGMLKRCMDMMITNPGSSKEEKDWAAQIATLVDSASGFMKSVFPQGGGQSQQMLPPPQQQSRLPHQAQRRIATGQPQQGMTAQQRQPVQQQPPAQQHAQAPQPDPELWRQVQVPAESPFPQGQVVTQDNRSWEQLNHEERQQLIYAMNQIPTGPLAAVIALKAIQTKAYQTQAEYQQMVQMTLKNLPVDLRVAIITKDEATVIALVKPYVEPHPELVSWFDSMAVLVWLKETLVNLIPHIVSMYGPEEVQKQELANAIAAHEAAQAEALALEQKQAETAATTPAPVEGAPAAPAADAVPVAPTAPEAPPQQMQAAAGGVVLDSVPAAPAAPAAPAPAKSHLDDPEAV